MIQDQQLTDFGNSNQQDLGKNHLKELVHQELYKVSLQSFFFFHKEQIKAIPLRSLQRQEVSKFKSLLEVYVLWIQSPGSCASYQTEFI